MNISILRRPLVGAFFVPKIWKIDEKKRVRDDRVDFSALDFGRQRDDARIGRVAGNRAKIAAATRRTRGRGGIRRAARQYRTARGAGQTDAAGLGAPVREIFDAGDRRSHRAQRAPF